MVSQYSNQLAPLSVDAVLKVIDPATATNVDLKDIKIVKKLGYVQAVGVERGGWLIIVFLGNVLINIVIRIICLV